MFNYNYGLGFLNNGKDAIKRQNGIEHKIEIKPLSSQMSDFDKPQVEQVKINYVKPDDVPF